MPFLIFYRVWGNTPEVGLLIDNVDVGKVEVGGLKLEPVSEKKVVLVDVEKLHLQMNDKEQARLS